MKKVVSLLAAASMLLGTLPVMAEAEASVYQTAIEGVSFGTDDTSYVSENLPMSVTVEGVEYAITYTDNSDLISETGEVSLPDRPVPVSGTASITADGVDYKTPYSVILTPGGAVKVFSDGFGKEIIDGAEAIAPAGTADKNWTATLSQQEIDALADYTAINMVNKNQNNAMELNKLQTFNSTVGNNLKAVHTLGTALNEGKVAVSFRMNSERTAFKIEAAPFGKIRKDKWEDGNIALSSDIKNNTWYLVTFIADLKTDTVWWYLDGELMGSKENAGIISISQISFCQQRADLAPQRVWIDDVAVFKLRDDANYYQSAIDGVSFGTNDTQYVRGDMPKSVKIDGKNYDITYTDESGRISSAGSVTLSDNFVPVSGTASITVEENVYSTDYSVILVPKNAECLFADGFGAETVEQETAIPDSSAENAVWKADQTAAAIAALSSKTTISTISLSGNNVLKLHKLAKYSDMANLKAVHTLDKAVTSGKAAYSFRFMPGNSSFNIQADPFGRITNGSWIPAGTTTLPINSFILNTWYLITFVADFENKTVDMYIDGAPVATWAEASVTQLQTLAFLQQRNQNPAPQTVYVDDAAVYVLCGDEIYLADADISANGTVNSVTFGGNAEKLAGASVILGAYNGGSLLGVKVLGKGLDTDTAIKVEGFVLPADCDMMKIFIWDMDTLTPAADAAQRIIQTQTPTIYLAGDSIVSEYSDTYYPRTGWGEVIGNYFDNSITVVNKAKSGADTASFAGDGLLNQIITAGAAGDYVLVQLGNNDHSHGIAIDDYKANLSQYIEKIADKGMHPVFITPIIEYGMPSGADDGVIANDLADYANAMKETAANYGIPCIDAYTLTAEAYGADAEGVKGWYMYIDANDSRYEGNPAWENSVYNKAEATNDGTHLQLAGAAEVAKLIAKGLKDSGIYFADKITAE